MWVHVTTDKGDVFAFPHHNHAATMTILNMIMKSDYPDARVTSMNLRSK